MISIPYFTEVEQPSSVISSGRRGSAITTNMTQVYPSLPFRSSLLLLLLPCHSLPCHPYLCRPPPHSLHREEPSAAARFGDSRYYGGRGPAAGGWRGGILPRDLEASRRAARLEESGEAAPTREGDGGRLGPELVLRPPLGAAPAPCRSGKPPPRGRERERKVRVGAGWGEPHHDSVLVAGWRQGGLGRGLHRRRSSLGRRQWPPLEL